MCPHCGSRDSLHSDSPMQHYLRLLVGSPKWYCPACDKKWISRPKRRRFSWQLATGLFLVAVLSILVVDNFATYFFHAQKQVTKSPVLNPKLMEKARQKLAKDPDALSKLSPEKRKKAEAYMKKHGIELPH